MTSSPTSPNETMTAAMLAPYRKSSSTHALLAGSVIAVVVLALACVVVAVVYVYVYWTRVHREIRGPRTSVRRSTIGAGIHDQPVVHVTYPTNERFTHVFMFHR